MELAQEPLVVTARNLQATRILDAARAHDAARDESQDQRIAEALGFALPDLFLTPFQRHAAVLAYNAGIVAFERLERSYPEPPKSWCRHDLNLSQLEVVRQGFGVYGGHTVWPFRQDVPMADFSVAHPAPWLTHACIHTLLGGVSWPELSEFELLHTARLSEVVAAWHWYWLAELGNKTCDIHSNFDGVDALAKCAECRAYAQEARRPEVRAERLNGEHAAMVASNAVSTFRYEVHAYWQGLLSGHIVVPSVDVLDHGEAADYARYHHRRMTSVSQRSWVEHCLQDGDFGGSPAAYAARASELVDALMRPVGLVTDAVRATRRAVRVLQDLGQRVADACVIEATSGGEQLSPEGTAVLTHIGDLISGLRGTDDTTVGESDAAVADALGRIAADLFKHREVFQLGYRPTLDPAAEVAASREARRQAYLLKLDATGSPWAPFARTTFRRALDSMLDGPRQLPLTQEVANGIFAAAHLDPDAFDEAQIALAEYIQGVAAHWGPEDGSRDPAKRWYYRLAPETAPPSLADWSRFRVRPNSNMGSLGSPFTATWLQKVIDGEPAVPETQHDAGFDPTRPQLAQGKPQFVLMGRGRRGPMFLPYIGRRSKLIDALQHTPTLAELLASGHTEDELRRAVDEEMVVLVGGAPVDLSEKLGTPVALLEMVTPGLTDYGPWEDAAQAAYYEALCGRSDHYAFAARAVVAALELEDDAHVADLGCGTGVGLDVLLTTLGPDACVVGVDPAPRMVATCGRLFTDGRLKVRRANAHGLREFVPLGPGFSAIICTSAFWLERSPEAALRALRGALRRGGQLALTFPSEYLGEAEHLMTPAAIEVAQAVAAVRESLGLTGPSAETKVEHDGDDEGRAATASKAPLVLGSAERLATSLSQGGYDDVRTQTVERPWAVAEYLDWMGQPVVLGGMLPEATEEERQKFLRVLGEHLDPDLELIARWTIVIGRRAG